MSERGKGKHFRSALEKFLGLSLESTRKSYYPQLKEQLDGAIENERRLQLLIDSLPARISYVDLEQRYVLVNRQYEVVFGLAGDQIVGCTKEEILGENNYAKVKSYIFEALGGKHVQCETRFTGSGGELKYLDVNFVPDIDVDGGVSGMYVLSIDITDKKLAEQERAKLELQLAEAQRIQSIGTLAGGLAHDFNNLMMGIQGRVSLMELALEEQDSLVEHIQAIEEYIGSATHLTRQLLGFARGGKYEVKAIDLNSLLLKSADMFGRTHKEIQIHRNILPIALVVEADWAQVEQVLINIYLNAWQAMPDGGNLRLDTKSEMLDGHLCKAHDVKIGSYAKIVITDDGVGMTEEDIGRVFDPFFTTKEKQRGTGLGLATAYGIVKNHGGFITVYSEVGRGTTFTIYLPLSEKKILPETQPERKIVQGSETILLVDDEEMILEVGQTMLEILGYSVFVAKGGEGALEILVQKGRTIDMVILDLVMPGLDGAKTFKRIRVLYPDMIVLLASGYSMDGQAQEVMNDGCNGFIQKPFNISELSQAIGNMLKR